MTSVLFNLINELLDVTINGEALLDLWLKAARDEVETQGDKFLTQNQQNKLVTEFISISRSLSSTFQLQNKAHIKGMWLGLFEQAIGQGYNYKLTTYIGLANTQQVSNPDWMYDLSVLHDSYTKLPVLTQYHKRKNDVSQNSNNVIYLYLPIVILAGLVKDFSMLKECQHIQHFGFGWDSGDQIVWKKSLKRKNKFLKFFNDKANRL